MSDFFNHVSVLSDTTIAFIFPTINQKPKERETKKNINSTLAVIMLF